MNKISLKNLNLNEVESLSREQLKNVMGGFDGNGSGGGGTGKGTCGINYYDTWGYKKANDRGLSKSEAISLASSWNQNHKSSCSNNCNAIAKWCCESC